MNLVLFLVTFAFAGSDIDQQTFEALTRQQAQIQALEAERDALKEQCSKACVPVVAPAPKPKTAKKPAPKPVAVVIEPVVDPKIAALEQEIASLKDQIAKLPVPAPAYDDTALADRIDKLEKAEPTTVTVIERTVVENTTTRYETGAHVIGYAGGGAVIAQPLPGFDQAVRGRVDLGARYTWDTSKNWVSGISGEVGFGGGVDVRAFFGAVHDTGFGGAVGVGYRCDDLGDQGCGAESTGAVIQGSWERSFGPGQAWGVIIRPGAEFNYASVPNLSGFETRATVNFDLYVGRAQATTVTAH